MATRETVLITGASAGIGLELARLFAADGSALLLVARRAERLHALAEELAARHSVRVDVLTEDLADRAAPRRLADALKAAGVSVDVLVNNAGFGAGGRFSRLEHERQAEMLDVNVAALTSLTRLLLPAMIERGRGGVLNVASTAAFQPGPYMAVYYATKAYVLSFTEALAEELRDTGVTVSCLCPGPTQTEFRDVAGMGDSLLFRLGMMDAASVARAGLAGLRRGRVVVIPGIRNRVVASSTRLSPRWLTRRLVARLQGPSADRGGA